MQGGHGAAGALAHKRTKLVAEGIDIGKHGFRSHSARELRTINVKDLSRLASPPSEGKSESELLLIDLSQLGYEKLLGAGVLKEPITVKVAKASKSAVRKIEEAGGKILLPK
jgi:large subunit ribosomal protein L15